MKISAKLLRGAAASLAAAAVVGGVAPAAPTPVPGGAYQLKGVTGGLSSTLFNGTLRVRNMRLRPATANEASPGRGQTALTFTYLVSNGTSKSQHGNLGASIVDADGVSVNGRSMSVYSAYYALDPGAATRGTIEFTLDAGFMPVKIVLGGGGGPVFRIDLKPSDVPGAATPSAMPAPSP